MYDIQTMRIPHRYEMFYSQFKTPVFYRSIFKKFSILMNISFRTSAL